MHKVYVNLTLKCEVIVRVDEGADLEEVLESIEFEAKSGTDEADVELDTYTVVGREIQDSK